MYGKKILRTAPSIFATFATTLHILEHADVCTQNMDGAAQMVCLEAKGQKVEGLRKCRSCCVSR